MVPPSPTELAELMGLSFLPGPPVLKTPTSEDLTRLNEVHARIFDRSLTFYAFASQFNAAYLFSLIQTLLAMPRSLEGTSGPWWELFVSILSGITPTNHRSGCVHLQRFVRENEADALRLYVFLMDALGAVGHLDPSHRNGKDTIIIALYRFWTFLVDALSKQLSSLPSAPQLSRQTLDGLAKLLDAQGLLPDAIMTTGKPSTLKVLELTPDVCYKAYKKLAMEPGPWWRCEVTRQGSWKELGSECVECSEGAEMEACSRCLTVRYCSKEHQRKDWKEHKRVCFETKW